MKEACENCRFFKSQAVNGACRKNPPEGFVVEGKVKWSFPLVKREEWCGNYEEKRS